MILRFNCTDWDPDDSSYPMDDDKDIDEAYNDGDIF